MPQQRQRGGQQRQKRERGRQPRAEQRALPGREPRVNKIGRACREHPQPAKNQILQIQRQHFAQHHRERRNGQRQHQVAVTAAKDEPAGCHKGEHQRDDARQHGHDRKRQFRRAVLCEHLREREAAHAGEIQREKRHHCQRAKAARGLAPAFARAAPQRKRLHHYTKIQLQQNPQLTHAYRPPVPAPETPAPNFRRPPRRPSRLFLQAFPSG